MSETRADQYARGFHDGRRWAEADIVNHVGALEPEYLDMRESLRAWSLGARRGYRDTWARFYRGEITRSTFDLMPL